MRINKDTWQFLRGYSTKTQLPCHRVKTFCRKTEYDVLLLVSEDTLEKLKYEPEVVGYSTSYSFKVPYKVYCVGVNTDSIQYILDKYQIIAILEVNGSGEITV